MKASLFLAVLIPFECFARETGVEQEADEDAALPGKSIPPPLSPVMPQFPPKNPLLVLPTLPSLLPLLHPPPNPHTVANWEAEGRRAEDAMLEGPPLKYGRADSKDG